MYRMLDPRLLQHTLTVPLSIHGILLL